MTKSVLDLANLLDILVDPIKTSIPKGGYKAALTDTWAGLKIGVLDPADWGTSDSWTKPHPGATKQMVRRPFPEARQAESDNNAERSIRECV